jgi:uncharacterized protein (TIGR02452 family)
MDRGTAARIGQETAAICEAGSYVAPSGRSIVVRDAIARAASGTRDFAPGAAVDAPPGAAATTRLEVTGETTLVAARRLAAEGATPAALNFASAHKPGGGFLSGARAQEESIARSSGLYPCLLRSGMYRHHEAPRDPMYTSWVIHSPGVPVFRDDAGTLLDEPWLAAMITCPAVNAKVVLERDPSRRREIAAVMRERTARVLAVAAAAGETTLVLGAWGCGVFGNEPVEIADIFAEALAGPFRDTFARVVFAILDFSAEQRFLKPFRRRFGG